MRPERDDAGGALPAPRALLRRTFPADEAPLADADMRQPVSPADAAKVGSRVDTGAFARDRAAEFPWDESVEALARRCLAEGHVDTDTESFRRRALHALRTLRPDASCADLSEAMLQLRLHLVRRASCVEHARARSMDTPDGTP